MMTSSEPDVVPGGYYSTAETARVLGVHRVTLQRWVKAGYIKPRYHRATLRPRFRGTDILAFWRGSL